ncbi:MAG TPA: TMEM175 family protein [Thermoleophilaceae bacterium]|nr:TMEM175 family protein [Thermoleophilaceae bacterium]
MGDRFETARMKAFSDGIFAIAITLLVLDIGLPDDAFDDLWRGLADEWPSYLADATSFWTIGGLWAVHHAVFRLRYANRVLTRVNLVLLMVVAFLPFPTSVVGEAVGTDTSEREAVLFYGATLFVISVIVTGMCEYARVPPRAPACGRHAAATLRGLAARTRPTLAFYGLVLLLALLAPRVAAFGFLALALHAFPAGSRPRRRAAAHLVR